MDYFASKPFVQLEYEYEYGGSTPSNTPIISSAREHRVSERALTGCQSENLSFSALGIKLITLSLPFSIYNGLLQSLKVLAMRWLPPKRRV